MIKPGQIIGKRVGAEPDNYLDHFYTCKACGQMVDMRDLKISRILSGELK